MKNIFLCISLLGQIIIYNFQPFIQILNLSFPPKHKEQNKFQSKMYLLSLL